MSAASDPAAPLRAIADELYALPAADFVAGRTARVLAVRDGGDRPLADAVGRLGRPTAAAALVNALVREAGSVEALVALGVRSRAAQDDGDAAGLRTLAAERRRLIADLVQRAATLPGHRAPGQSVLDEVERTLTSAVLDGAAADAVQSGRLVRALSADGVEPADVADAVAGGTRSDAAAPVPSSPTRPSAERRAAEELLRQADREAEAARQQFAQAATAATAAERTSVDRVAAADDLRRQVADLRRRLGAAEAAVDSAEDDLDAARTALRTARRTAERADAAAEQARAVLQALTR